VARHPQRAAGLDVRRRLFSILVLLLAGSAVAFAAASDTGTVEGTVHLPSAAPANTAAHVMAETVYPHGAITAMDMPADPPVAVVYAEPSDDATRAAVIAFRAASKPADATVTQKDLRFIPALLPVLVGASVSFPNEDDIYHNVFSYSAPKPFDLGRYRKGESPGKVTFDKPGTVKVYCEIHDHMRCTILVLDTPFFTTTDPAGHYHLAGLLPGNYTLTVWVGDKSLWTSPLEIHPGSSLHTDLAPPAK